MGQDQTKQPEKNTDNDKDDEASRGKPIEIDLHDEKVKKTAAER